MLGGKFDKDFLQSFRAVCTVSEFLCCECTFRRFEGYGVLGMESLLNKNFKIEFLKYSLARLVKRYKRGTTIQFKPRLIHLCDYWNKYETVANRLREMSLFECWKNGIYLTDPPRNKEDDGNFLNPDEFYSKEVLIRIWCNIRLMSVREK